MVHWYPFLVCTRDKLNYQRSCFVFSQYLGKENVDWPQKRRPATSGMFSADSKNNKTNFITRLELRAFLVPPASASTIALASKPLSRHQPLMLKLKYSIRIGWNFSRSLSHPIKIKISLTVQFRCRSCNWQVSCNKNLNVELFDFPSICEIYEEKQ